MQQLMQTKEMCMQAMHERDWEMSKRTCGEEKRKRKSTGIRLKKEKVKKKKNYIQMLDATRDASKESSWVSRCIQLHLRIHVIDNYHRLFVINHSNSSKNLLKEKGKQLDN